MKPVALIPSELNPGNIIVLRNYNYYGAGIHYWITLNEEDVAGLYTNEHTAFLLPIGQYRIGVRCHGGWLPTWKLDEINIDVEPNQTYYFLVTPKVRLLLNDCGEIELISEEDGLNRLKKSNKVPTGTYSKDMKLLPR